MHRPPTRLILVKDITGQQNKVDFVGAGQMQDFLEGREGIVAADGIAFEISEVIVGGEEDS